jgi:hypothetical protein
VTIGLLRLCHINSSPRPYFLRIRPSSVETRAKLALIWLCLANAVCFHLFIVLVKSRSVAKLPIASSPLAVDTTVLRGCGAILLCLSGLGLCHAFRFASCRGLVFWPHFVCGPFRFLNLAERSGSGVQDESGNWFIGDLWNPKLRTRLG